MIKNASFLINFKIHWIMSIMLKLSLKRLIIWLKIPFPTLSLIPFTHPTNRPNSWPFLFTYLEKFIPFSCLHILSQDNSFFKNLLQKKKTYYKRNNCLRRLFSRHPWAPICSLFSLPFPHSFYEVDPTLCHTSSPTSWLPFVFAQYDAPVTDPKAESARY